MGRSQPYFKGQTKTQVEKEVQGILELYQIAEEFSSEYLSDLITEKHYYCSQHRIRPTSFRKEFKPGSGYYFAGYFQDKGWHQVSWKQCIYPRRDEDWIVTALRDAVRPDIVIYKQAHLICERCGQIPSEDVDHVEPEFDVIAKSALKLMTEDDWRAAIFEMDWWSDEPFVLPENNPALQYTLESHKNVTLQAVCKDCHSANARERKSSKNL